MLDTITATVLHNGVMESAPTRPGTEQPVSGERPVRGGFADPALLGLPGLDQLRHVLAVGGPPPPLHYLTGLMPTEVELGACAAFLPATPWLMSSQGSLPAGAIALLADSALGIAAQTALPAATLYTTAEVSIDLLRHLTPGAGSLTARARNLHTGRSVVVSEALVCDDQGRLIARASSRCHILPPLDLPGDAPLPEWSDPGYAGAHPYQRPPVGGPVPLEEWLRRSGAEVLDAQRDGDLPVSPLHHLTGIRPLDWSDGACTVAGPASPWLTAPHGNLAGGAIALLADSALTAAVQTTVAPGQGFAMLDLRANFIRPVPPDDTELTARAEVLHRGRTTRMATAEVTNSSGKRVAVASGSALMLDSPLGDRQT